MDPKIWTGYRFSWSRNFHIPFLRLSFGRENRRRMSDPRKWDRSLVYGWPCFTYRRVIKSVIILQSIQSGFQNPHSLDQDKGNRGSGNEIAFHIFSMRVIGARAFAKRNSSARSWNISLIKEKRYCAVWLRYFFPFFCHAILLLALINWELVHKYSWYYPSPLSSDWKSKNIEERDSSSFTALSCRLNKLTCMS